MGSDDKSRFDRRSVLKAIGATGAIASLGGAVQALGGAEKTDRIESAVRTESFETFESAFGSISVDHEASSVTRLDDGVERSVRAELRTNLGTMGVIVVDADDVSFDVTLLDLAAARTDAIPAAYADAPDGTRPMLYAASGHDGIEFRRDVTDEERRALAKRTGIPEPDVEAALETEAGGFVVGGGAELDDGEYLLLEVAATSFSGVSATTIDEASLVREEVSPNLSLWCSYRCASCLSKAAGCVGCCVAATVACIACIIWNCGLGANACYDCYDCL